MLPFRAFGPITTTSLLGRPASRSRWRIASAADGCAANRICRVDLDELFENVVRELFGGGIHFGPRQI